MEGHISCPLIRPVSDFARNSFHLIRTNIGGFRLNKSIVKKQVPPHLSLLKFLTLNFSSEKFLYVGNWSLLSLFSHFFFKSPLGPISAKNLNSSISRSRGLYENAGQHALAWEEARIIKFEIGVDFQVFEGR